MQDFSKKRFDVVLHTFNIYTRKILHIYLKIFQKMYEIISSDMFDNAATKDYHSKVPSFHAVTLNQMLSSFFGNCFPLVFAYTWKIDELSQLWFSFLISLVELPLMFVLTILLSFALLLIAPLSVLKSSLLFTVSSIDSVISINDSNKSSASGLTILLSLLTKIWFPLLTEIL